LVRDLAMPAGRITGERRIDSIANQGRHRRGVTRRGRARVSAPVARGEESK
jgi:hypothetical protein